MVIASCLAVTTRVKKAMWQRWRGYIPKKVRGLAYPAQVNLRTALILTAITRRMFPHNFSSVSFQGLYASKKLFLDNRNVLERDFYGMKKLAN